MQPAADLANRLLERESWARARLAAHAGRSFVVTIGPIASAFAIDSSGMFEGASLSGARPDLTLHVAPWNLPPLAADPARWDTFVTTEGDTALAATLRELAVTTPLWIEQLFARVLGPVAGQRAADVGRSLLAFPEIAAQRLTDNLMSYLRDESGMLARGDEARLLSQEAARLAMRTDLLATRLQALEQRLAAHAGAARPSA